MLTMTLSALSQVAGGASAPERLRELVAWHRPARLGHQVCEQQPALPSWKVRLVDHLSVGFDCDSACEKDLQLESSCALPGS